MAAIAAFETAAIVVLHQLGRIEWMTIPYGEAMTWLELAPLEDVVAAIVRTLALAIAYWITASSVLYAIARLSRVPALIRATAWTTLPPIRRAIDRTVAMTLAGATLATPLAPAIASELPAPPPIIYQISDQGIPTPVAPPPLDPSLVTPPGSVGAGYTPRPAGGIEIAEVSPGAEATKYEVVSGDNLWTISSAHLSAAMPDAVVTASEIAPYWRLVIEQNTPRLRSGDPNLIYPGEVIHLPAIQGGREQ